MTRGRVDTTTWTLRALFESWTSMTVIWDNLPFITSSSPGCRERQGLQTFRCKAPTVATQGEHVAQLLLPDGNIPLWEEGEALEIPEKVMGLLRLLLKQ